MVVSQRPSEVDDTILSQCGTFIALRLSNSSDRVTVQKSLPDNLAGVVESLPVLRVGEAIITGEAARLPIRCRILLPSEEHRPNSQDPQVYRCWQRNRASEAYLGVANSWRTQNPLWALMRVLRISLPTEEIHKMERESVVSTTILSVGYEPNSNTLEVEFKSGGIYQYYNVPEPLFQALMDSDSKGKFLHANIKSAFAYSRV